MTAAAPNSKWFVRVAATVGLVCGLALRAFAHGGGGGGGGMSHMGGNSFSSHAMNSPAHVSVMSKGPTGMNSKVNVLPTNSFKTAQFNSHNFNTLNTNKLNNVKVNALKNTGINSTAQSLGHKVNVNPVLTGANHGFKPTSGAIITGSGLKVAPLPNQTFKAPPGGFKTLPAYAKCGPTGCFPQHNCWPYPIYCGPYYGLGYYPFLYSSYRYPTYRNTTYVNMPIVSTATPATTVEGIDLQLVDIRRLDAGDAAKQIGPRYRVTFRNAGTTPIDREFEVSVVASDKEELSPNLPMAETRITAVPTGETKYVDLRLPPTAFEMGSDAKTEFAKLFIVVDSRQEVNDANRDNNGAMLDRTVIEPAT